MRAIEIGAARSSHLATEIVRLANSDIVAAVVGLARAFLDDPLMIYALPDRSDRVRLLPEVYARMIRFGSLAGEVYRTARKIGGVAVWLPPDAKWTRENLEASRMHRLGDLIGSDAYERYCEVVGREWQARQRDMAAACWYLFLLGVEPSLQRQGLGGDLIRPILKRADRDNLACYLETENPATCPSI
jgi:GNAT superfamily N-acetyltransferase